MSGLEHANSRWLRVSDELVSTAAEPTQEFWETLGSLRGEIYTKITRDRCRYSFGIFLPIKPVELKSSKRSSYTELLGNLVMLLFHAWTFSRSAGFHPKP